MKSEKARATSNAIKPDNKCNGDLVKTAAQIYYKIMLFPLNHFTANQTSNDQ